MEVIGRVESGTETESNAGRLYGCILPTYPAAVRVAGEFLATNYSFYLTSINITEWVPAVKPIDPNKGAAHWRQTVSLSAVAVFDLQGGSSDQQPDWVDSIDSSINDQTTKFTELRVMGFGTVFKAIGVQPSTSGTVHTRQFKDKSILLANPPTINQFDPVPPAAWGFASFEETKDSFEIRGLTARWVGAWKATVEEV